MSKKQADEKLQDIRNKGHNKIRYRKRIQEQREADDELKKL